MKLGIIVTTFNGEKLIDPLLNSIAEVLREGLEVAVYFFDDCSSDGTVEYIRRRLGELPANIFRNPRNLGECENTNRGFLTMARDGVEWTIVAHQDDLLLASWVRYLAEALKRCGPEVAMACCHQIYVEGEVRREEEISGTAVPDSPRRLHPGTPETIDSLSRRWFWAMSSSCIRTEAYLAIGGMHPYLTSWGDNDFLVRFFAAGYGLLEVEAVGFVKRYTPNSQTGRQDRNASGLTNWCYIMFKYLRFSSRPSRVRESWKQVYSGARLTARHLRRRDWYAVRKHIAGTFNVLRGMAALFAGTWLLPAKVRFLLDHRFVHLAGAAPTPRTADVLHAS